MDIDVRRRRARRKKASPIRRVRRAIVSPIRRVRGAITRARGIFSGKNIQGALIGFTGFSTSSHLIEKYRVSALGFGQGVIPYRQDKYGFQHYVGIDDLISVGVGTGLGYLFSKKLIPSLIGALLGLFAEKEGEITQTEQAYERQKGSGRGSSGGGGSRDYLRIMLPYSERFIYSEGVNI